MNGRVLLVLLVLAVGCRPPAAPPPPPAESDKLPAAAELELAYLSTEDLFTKIQIMSDLADVPPAEAVEIIGRLFYFEQDPELREELLYSLVDINGQTEAKRQLLEEALHPDLPLGVRLMAIDLLVELADPRARPALQKYLADPNQEVRQAIEDALQDLM